MVSLLGWRFFKSEGGEDFMNERLETKRGLKRDGTADLMTKPLANSAPVENPKMALPCEVSVKNKHKNERVVLVCVVKDKICDKCPMKLGR